MELRILGCHGGASDRHRQVSILIDGRLALDGGSVANALSVEAQRGIETVLVTHPHIDHVADLGPLSDLRCQQGGPTLNVFGLAETLDSLRRHVFNDVIWPDFSRILAGDGPTIALHEFSPEETVSIGDYVVLAVPVHHSVPSCGFVVRSPSGTMAYSGDTGPTRRFWEVAGQEEDLRAVITEVSYPDRKLELAHTSGHLTPALLAAELEHLSRPAGLPIYLYGFKPLFEEEILAELEALALPDVSILRCGETIRL